MWDFPLGVIAAHSDRLSDGIETQSSQPDLKRKYQVTDVDAKWNSEHDCA